MEPKKWGAKVWYLMHIIAFSFIPENKKYYNEFYNIIKVMLPCKKCRTNFNRELGNKVNQNIDNLSTLMINLHNNVSARLKKKVYSYAEIEKIYYKDKILQINYGKIDDAINTLILYNNINSCKRLIKILKYVYPCPKMRNKFMILIKDDEVNKLKNKYLFNKYNKELKQNCIEYDKNPEKFIK